MLRPQGKALIGKEELIKPFPEGLDDWSHPYHGPDNNPQSKDLIARAPYLTQFLAEPYYAPLTQVSVASAGRVFKAFGNIAFHVREEALLNSLVAFNGYNGTKLWQRSLNPGVMIHRNTMIATPDVLYVGNDKSCKLIDTGTGRLIDEITPSEEIAGGTVRLDLVSNRRQWISPMRPQCHDGVTIANGLLYWWPSVCDCQNTLYGITCLGPAGDFDFYQEALENERLVLGNGDLNEVSNRAESPSDWPTFRANNKGTATTEAVIP